MNIYIGGDSWGLGEWSGDIGHCGKVIHKGLEQYLKDDGHNVINKSIPGGSNLSSYRELKKKSSDEFDCVVLFQTVSMRDVFGCQHIRTWPQFLDKNEELMNEFYHHLSSLPFKIYLVGGLEKVSEQADQYPNLVPLIKSVPEWLTDYKYIAKPLSFYDGVSNDADKEILENLEQNLYSWIYDVSQCEEYFMPDGWHVNRHGHKRIYDSLKQELEL